MPFDDVKNAFRKMALELHPDRKNGENDGKKFQEVAMAYEYLKNLKNKNTPREKINPERKNYTNFKAKQNFDRKKTRDRTNEKIPEEDWGKYTRGFEEDNPDFWKAYEKNFWEEYAQTINANGKNGEYEKAKESNNQPDLFVDVDKTLCIGCCSCETIAPQVFRVDKSSRLNPKSGVINSKGAKFNKIMDAAQTCPTKAINVTDKSTRQKLFPY